MRTSGVMGSLLLTFEGAHNFSMLLDSSAFVAGPELISVLWKHAVSLDCAEDLELFRPGDGQSGLYFMHSGEAIMIMENDCGDSVLRALTHGTGIDSGHVGFVTRDDFSILMLTEPAHAMMIRRVLAAEVPSSRVALSEWRTAPRRRRGPRRKRSMAGSKGKTAN
jgi:hypothetical protein